MVQIPNRPGRAASDLQYQEMCERVAGFQDRLGTPLDPGIFETVVMLNLQGFPTLQSCEGHLDHGCFYPWVTVVDQQQDRLVSQLWVQVCDLQAKAQTPGTQEACDTWLAADVALQLVVARYEQGN